MPSFYTTVSKPVIFCSYLPANVPKLQTEQRLIKWREKSSSNMFWPAPLMKVGLSGDFVYAYECNVSQAAFPKVCSQRCVWNSSSLTTWWQQCEQANRSVDSDCLDKKEVSIKGTVFSSWSMKLIKLFFLLQEIWPHFQENIQMLSWSSCVGLLRCMHTEMWHWTEW